MALGVHILNILNLNHESVIMSNIENEESKVFIEYSRIYADINALGPDWEQYFSSQINNLKDINKSKAFKIGFAKAISGKEVFKREYEIATGWDFDSEEEYRDHLLRLWNIFYPGEDFFIYL